MAQQEVYRKKPETIPELMSVVEDFAKSLSKVRRMVQNIRKRAQICVDQNGGHFEHMLKK